MCFCAKSSLHCSIERGRQTNTAVGGKIRIKCAWHEIPGCRLLFLSARQKSSLHFVLPVSTTQKAFHDPRILKLPRRRRRYRRGRPTGRKHQTLCQTHHAPRSVGRLGRLRRAGGNQQKISKPRPCERHGRRGHQAQARLRMGQARHGRHRFGGHERERYFGAGRRAFVFLGLFCVRQTGCSARHRCGQRHCGRLRRIRLRPDWRRNGGNARHVSRRRIRFGGLCRGRGGKRPRD